MKVYILKKSSAIDERAFKCFFCWAYSSLANLLPTAFCIMCYYLLGIVFTPHLAFEGSQSNSAACKRNTGLNIQEKLTAYILFG